MPGTGVNSMSSLTLKSCDMCGVVLDASKLPFNDNFYGECGEIDEKYATWDSDRMGWFPHVKCPVCGNKILGEV